MGSIPSRGGVVPLSGAGDRLELKDRLLRLDARNEEEVVRFWAAGASVPGAILSETPCKLDVLPC